ncbi:hypothetical protein FIBSPDRAFT_928415 [Athelia psychrophila]|uniref:Ubiquitin-like domain-containing protein n=1 Tax=Athelia psychrophila TaxID=1759441 RepID=A0A166Q430_9AGAM|nr:hypothetical protein FIBSPDRAFT_928415 [Fibularhizoctonia sp. CBS 109695]
MASLQSPDESDSRTTTFNTHHTSGGTVINVNGNCSIQGNHTVAQINHFISSPSPEQTRMLERLRETHNMHTVTPSLGTEAHGPIRGPSTAPTAAPHVTINNVEAHTSAQDASIEIQSGSASFRNFTGDVASLRRMLTLSELAVRVYQRTPLAQALNHFIIAEAERCRQLLKDLFNNLSDYRHALPAVLFHFIRQYVWSKAREGGTVGDLNSKLRKCHGSFAACILGLGRSFAGDALVKRGDYRILKQDDDQVITPSELSTVIRPGMTVEMSIVLPKDVAAVSNMREVCQRLERDPIPEERPFFRRICMLLMHTIVPARQELHNYLQALYRKSDVLNIPVQEVNRGVWRADVLIHGSLVVQATGPNAHDAREEGAARALMQHREWWFKSVPTSSALSINIPLTTGQLAQVPKKERLG